MQKQIGKHFFGQSHDLKIENRLKLQIDDKEEKVSKLQKQILMKDRKIEKIRKKLLKLGVPKTEVYGDSGDDDAQTRRLSSFAQFLLPFPSNHLSRLRGR